MRLLAYGGTSYIERSRIGAWPTIAEGALSDTYGLVGDKLVYGTGLLKDENPFLIIRQRQNVQNRGGYAFSLFLDPGIEVWKRFGWNGASMIQSLLESHDGTARQLFAQPEVLTESKLGELLSKLKLPAASPETEEREMFTALLMGSITSTQQVIAAPASLGFGERPSLQETAASLSKLAPCFRCGYGWLVGGSNEHGQVFGAHLVLDEGTVDSDEVAGYIEYGREIISAWKTVSTQDNLRDTVEQYSSFLVSEWQSQSKESLQQTFKKIIALDRKFAQYVDLSSGSDTLTYDQTHELLSFKFDRNARLNEQTIRRLDQQALVDELAKRCIPPTYEYSRMHLSWAIRLAVWRKLVEAEEKTLNIPLRLRSALEDLAEEAPESSSQIDELIKLAINQSLIRSGKLGIWLNFQDDELLKNYLPAPLQSAAINCVREQCSTEWALDYLVFGKDAGGKLLHQSNVGQPQAGIIVTTFLNESQGDKRFHSEAKTWLVALASSPFRRSISVKDKIELARAIDGDWNDLLELWQLYSGRNGSSDTPRLKRAETDREMMFDELREMSTTYKVGSAVPNLQGIVEFLGELPTDVQEPLRQLEPILTWKTSAQWLNGWQTLNRRDIYQAELIRLLTHDGVNSPQDFSFTQLEDGTLNRLIEKLLFDGRTDDQRRTTQLLAILRQGQGSQRLKDTINSIFKDSIQKPINLEFFEKAFFDQTELLNLLFSFLDSDLKEEIMAARAEKDEEKFQKEAYELYRCAVEQVHPLLPYERAVFNFLRSPKGDNIKKQVATWYHTFLFTEDIDGNLCELLGPLNIKVVEEVDEEPAAVPTTPWHERFAKKLKQVLPTRLHSLIFSPEHSSDNTTPESPSDQPVEDSVAAAIETAATSETEASNEKVPAEASDEKALSVNANKHADAETQIPAPKDIDWMDKENAREQSGTDLGLAIWIDGDLPKIEAENLGPRPESSRPANETNSKKQK